MLLVHLLRASGKNTPKLRLPAARLHQVAEPHVLKMCISEVQQISTEAQTERAVDQFSSFLIISEKANKYRFGGVWVLFSDSLGLFTSIALGFVPKDPLGLDNKPRQNFKKLGNLSKKRSV